VPKQTLSAPTVLTSRRPFSNVVRAGNAVYVAGQLPIDGQGNTIGAGDIAAQTRQVLTNIRALVEAAGAPTSSRPPCISRTWRTTAR
jgi:enamine deaminase RidA (YjgF/YER057c/UK114 family)